MEPVPVARPDFRLAGLPVDRSLPVDWPVRSGLTGTGTGRQKSGPVPSLYLCMEMLD